MERKQIKKEDLIDGNIYWYSNAEEIIEYKKSGKSRYLNRTRTHFIASNYAFCDDIFEATDEEREHLLLCIGADQFVPFTKKVYEPKIINQFPIY